MKKFLSLSLLFLTFTTLSFSADLPGVQKNGKWRILGAGGGGTTYGPVVSYHDEKYAVVRSDMVCNFVTYDGGESWRQFNFGMVAECFSFDRNSKNVLYAGSNALYRSEDFGKTWNMVFPDPKKGTFRIHREDHGEQYLTTDDTTFPVAMTDTLINAICIDPSNSNKIYISFASEKGLVYGSIDYGKSWKKIKEADGRILRLWIRPAGVTGKTKLFALGEKGIYAGDNLDFVSGPKDQVVLDGSFGENPGTGKLIFYATCEGSWKDGKYQGGIFVSEDGGSNWLRRAEEIYALNKGVGAGAYPKFFRIAASEKNPETAYAGFEKIKMDDTPGAKREGNFNGIIKTTDSGKTWQVVNAENDGASEKFKDISYVERDTPGSGWNIWSDWPRGIAVSPTNPDYCYFTDCFRVYRTTNGGKTFYQKNSINQGDRRYTSRGIDLTTTYGVHFDPFNKEHLFISYTDMGLFNSFDRGASFYRAIDGIPKDSWANTCYWLEFDPEVKDLVFGVWSATHDLPYIKMWRKRPGMLPNQAGGAAISTDGGKSWTVSNKGMEEAPLTHILLDPKTPAGNRTLYACGFGKGVYKSVDNGKSWELKNNGIQGVNPFAWRMTRNKEGVLYLCVYRKGAEGYFGPAYDGAIYRSVDGAENWEKVKLPNGVNAPRSLTVDPKDSNVLYVSTWGICHVGTFLPDTGGGVFMSTDTGKSWKNIFKEGQHCDEVTVHPDDNKILFVTGMDNEVYRSDDRGVKWYRLPGFTYKQGKRVIVDPANHDMIYVTTFGSSVWYGPAKGDPDAKEDIVNRPPLFPVNKFGY